MALQKTKPTAEAEATAEVTMTETVDIAKEPSEQPVANVEAELNDKAVAIKEQIDVGSVSNVLTYGSEAQTKISDFADKILVEARTSDMDEVGGQVLAIINKQSELDMTSLSKPASFLQKLPVIGHMFDKITKFKQQFESVAEHIEQITVNLNASRDKLVEHVVMLDEFYEANTQQILDLEDYIIAGKAKIDEYHNVILPAMQADYEASGNDQIKAQEINDLNNSIQRFEKKVSDLEVVRMSALQTGPQLRLIQEGNITLSENIKNTLELAIPSWKKQFVMVLSLKEQQKAAEMETAIKDANNAMIQQTADLMQTNAVAIAETNQRSVIDIETLEHVQQSLITTLTETRRIAEEGKAKRVAAGERMKEMEEEIKTIMVAEV